MAPVFEPAPEVSQYVELADLIQLCSRPQLRFNDILVLGIGLLIGIIAYSLVHDLALHKHGCCEGGRHDASVTPVTLLVTDEKESPA